MPNTHTFAHKHPSTVTLRPLLLPVPTDPYESAVLDDCNGDCSPVPTNSSATELVAPVGIPTPTSTPINPEQGEVRTRPRIRLQNKIVQPKVFIDGIVRYPLNLRGFLVVTDTEPTSHSSYGASKVERSNGCGVQCTHEKSYLETDSTESGTECGWVQMGVQIEGQVRWQ